MYLGFKQVFEIAREISSITKNYPVIFTCGGVGPTHDDLTYEGIAECFHLKKEENKELLEIYAKLMLKEPEVKRLCTVPTPCKVIRVKSAGIPLFILSIIFLLFRILNLINSFQIFRHRICRN